MLGVDREMCETDVDKRALVGVSVVDTKGGVLLKTLVKPPGDHSRPQDGHHRLADEGLQRRQDDLGGRAGEVEKIVTPNTVLVGHGLVHDLRALRFDHAPVIDTAMLFSYKNLPRSTPGLADLWSGCLSGDARERRDARLRGGCAHGA